MTLAVQPATRTSRPTGALTVFARLTAALFLTASVAAMASPASAAVEVSKRDVLRVCADSHLMPYSNEAGEGFENAIARMIADELDIPLSYYWWPQSMGFVRNTLRARQCDLVIGTASGEELMQNTNPYYRSVYVLVYRTGSGITARGLDDPGLRGARFGVVEGTPAVNLLRRYGHSRSEPYQLVTDTRKNHPVLDAVQDVARGTTDAAILWGPMAAYYAAREAVPLTVVPLVNEPTEARLQFNISMGLRGDEPDWRHWLNDFLKRRQGDIERLLIRYQVPLVAGNGTLKIPAALEPEGYRQSDYRAPTPGSLTGAHTLTIADMRELHDAHPDIPLIDVMPAPVRPADHQGNWVPPPRMSLPGAVWLPNTGRGELAGADEDYLRQALETLSAGQHDRPMVFFCEPDCWMSWNAAKRAVTWGYTAVQWFPDGARGWEATGKPLAPITPWKMEGAELKIRP